MGAVPAVWLMPREDMGPRVFAGAGEVDKGYPKPCATSTYELCKRVTQSLGYSGSTCAK